MPEAKSILIVGGGSGICLEAAKYIFEISSAKLVVFGL